MKMAIWDNVYYGMKPMQVLDIALKLNFEGVQFQWWNLRNLSQNAKKEIARKTSSEGLKIAAVNLGQDFIPFVRLNFSGELSMIKGEIDRAVDSCIILGSENIIVRGMRRFECEKNDERICLRTRKHFSYLLEKLNGIKMQLLIEQFPTPSSWIPSLIPDSSHVIKMIEELRNEKVGFAFDVGHAIMVCESYLKVLKIHSKKIEYLLLNDNIPHPFTEKNSPYCGVDFHLPLTTGILTDDDISKIIACFKNSNSRNWICLNICSRKENALEVIRENKKILMKKAGRKIGERG